MEDVLEAEIANPANINGLRKFVKRARKYGATHVEFDDYGDFVSLRFYRHPPAPPELTEEEKLAEVLRVDGERAAVLHKRIAEHKFSLARLEAERAAIIATRHDPRTNLPPTNPRTASRPTSGFAGHAGRRGLSRAGAGYRGWGYRSR